MTDLQYIYNWMEYYSEIDFNSLSKFEITETPKETNADLIFMISNALHKSRAGNYEITKQDKLYYKKIIKQYGNKNL